jgi:hypothetical protein
MPVLPSGFHGNLVAKRSAAIANSQILKIYPPHEFNEFEP